MINKFVLFIFFTSCMTKVPVDRQKELKIDFVKLISCEKKVDCVIAHDFCGKPKAINKKWKSKFSLYVSKHSETIFCGNLKEEDWPDDTNSLSTLCLNNECKIKVQQR